MNWRPALAGVLAVGAITVLGVAVIPSAMTATPASTAPAASSAPAAKPAVPAVPSPSSPPVSISIPSIGVMAMLGTPLGLNPDGTVQVPPVNTPDVPAWFSLGTRPGDPGNSVIIGHVDGAHMLGVFTNVNKLAVGSQIKIGRANGTAVTFNVTAVETVRKSQFPSQAVYGPTTETWLALVTCGGRFDAASGNYEDSVIAFAKLTP